MKIFNYNFTQKNIKPKHLDSGFTLLISIITTSLLLIVSFVVVNVSLKQVVQASSARESQYAFYAADGGTECAVYWDLNDSSQSAFATSTITNPVGTINCGNNVPILTNSQSVQTTPTPTPSRIGGGGNANPTSIFQVTFRKGCAIVRVTKEINGYTTINSRGYNTCDPSAPRRFERGVTLTYYTGF